MSKDWNGELRACRDGADVMINSATDNVAMVYHKHGEDRLSRASYIAKAVNAYPALEAENKRLRDLLRECRVHAETRKNHAQHALYCTNGGPESLPYKARLKAITDLLARIHKALKGGE